MNKMPRFKTRPRHNKSKTTVFLHWTAATVVLKVLNPRIKWPQQMHMTASLPLQAACLSQLLKGSEPVARFKSSSCKSIQYRNHRQLLGKILLGYFQLVRLYQADRAQQIKLTTYYSLWSTMEGKIHRMSDSLWIIHSTISTLKFKLHKWV